MSPITDSRSRILLALVLAALMAATRGQQLAPLAHHLPDASLAVFFLAGFYLRTLWTFPAFFVLATVIDLTAIGWGGVSGYCMTPAYWLLVPAYGVVWGLGRWSADRVEVSRFGLARLAAILGIAAVSAELLATGGFYLYSGYFAEPNLAELLGRVATYLPATLLHLLAYVGILLVAQLSLARSLRDDGSTGATPR
ncbi:MAG: hypothetical protein EOM91_02545 [Sphingobacteriia bacterium]|nr:hypothetical protein [Sphingobacteriia bacterium]NCC39837.1 hypothetical protein [Gammaproteobacteria bacterium]